ncbi:MAG: nickel pincer cofactor biosynthesis protein LarB [Desulfobacterales bacterium]
MNDERIKDILQQVAEGKTSPESALGLLRHLACEDLGYAHIDHHRSVRHGFPEVIFGEGKSAEQVLGIFERLAEQEPVILVTRLDPLKARPLRERFPQAVYHEEARMLVWENPPLPVRGRGTILVLAAGTSDLPVALEAFHTARAMGNRVEKVVDVGVAGIHRLFRHREALERASVLVVVAGMEGALPSVVGGLVGRPVIAVPTSVGYGASLGGLTALLAMLNSCSANVAVVNIDNGFGAGYVAAMINRP